MSELDHIEAWEPIGAFKPWCWRRLLRVPWTKELEPILKEINSKYSLEGLMLKLQYFGHLMQRADSLEKTLMLGKIEGKRIREQQRKRRLNSITDSVDMNFKLWKIVKDREAWHVAVHGVAKSQTWISHWKTTTTMSIYFWLWLNNRFYCSWYVSNPKFNK